MNINLTVDALGNRHPISSYVYGGAYPQDAPTITDSGLTVVRWGGNATSRYNWQFNGDNRGQDWYFESLGDASGTAGERGDTFITTSRGAGAQPMITVPIIDWVAKLGSGRGKLSSGVARTAAELFRGPADPVRDVATHLLEINLLEVRHRASPPR